MVVAEEVHRDWEGVGDDRHISDHARAAVGAAAAGREAYVRNVTQRIGLEVGLFCDKPDVAGEGTLSKQRPLRTLQHLDAFQVDDPRIDRLRNWCIVDIEPAGASPPEQDLASDKAA